MELLDDDGLDAIHDRLPNSLELADPVPDEVVGLVVLVVGGLVVEDGEDLGSEQFELVLASGGSELDDEARDERDDPEGVVLPDWVEPLPGLGLCRGLLLEVLCDLVHGGVEGRRDELGGLGLLVVGGRDEVAPLVDHVGEDDVAPAGVLGGKGFGGIEHG